MAVHNLEGLGNDPIRFVLQANQFVNRDSSRSDSVYFPKNMESSNATTAVHKFPSADNFNEKLEICGFNLRGKCCYGNKCNALHTALPYQWQYYDLLQWKNFPEDTNREIELKFCDYEEDAVVVEVVGVGSLNINLQEMEGRKFFGRFEFLFIFHNMALIYVSKLAARRFQLNHQTRKRNT